MSRENYANKRPSANPPGQKPNAKNQPKPRDFKIDRSSPYSALMFDALTALKEGQQYFITDRAEDNAAFELGMLEAMFKVGYELHSSRMLGAITRFTFVRTKQ